MPGEIFDTFIWLEKAGFVWSGSVNVAKWRPSPVRVASRNVVFVGNVPQFSGTERSVPASPGRTSQFRQSLARPSLARHSARVVSRMISFVSTVTSPLGAGAALSDTSAWNAC